MNTQKGFGVVAALIVVAVLAIAGGGAYVAIKHNTAVKTKDTAEGTNQNDQSNTNDQGSSDQMSLRALITAGDNVQCTFSQSDETSNMTGTVYIDGATQHMRGDFTVTSEGAGTMNGHMVKTDGTLYSWMEGQNQGTKITADAHTTTEAGSESSVDLDTKVAFQCENWNVDQSKFDLPNDVQFMDMSAIMDDTTSVDASGRQCSACEAIPDETAKQQCLTALSCE